MRNALGVFVAALMVFHLSFAKLTAEDPDGDHPIDTGAGFKRIHTDGKSVLVMVRVEIEGDLVEHEYVVSVPHVNGDGKTVYRQERRVALVKPS